MPETGQWRDGVTVARGASLAGIMRDPSGTGRASVFDFSGAGGRRTWIGNVTVPPLAKSGAHHHGRHEVAIYIVKGRLEIRWGERLEFAADVDPGDFVYFSPFVPHQEFNADERKSVELVAIRSDNETIAVPLDVVPVERPEYLA